jgi:2-dehydropantoate 2-reductase
MDRIIAEVFVVMVAAGYRTHWQEPGQFLDVFYSRLVPDTAAHESSMLQDITAGRRTEIEALNGAISRYAAELGISTPYNDLITNLIKFKEKPQNQGKGRSTGPDAP